MSGMKAGLVFPTWPDIGGQWIPGILFDGREWNSKNFNEYDQGTFMAALVHTLHRSLAYVLTIIVLYYFFKGIQFSVTKQFKNGIYALLVVTLLQVLLGILTVINCVGIIPVGLGVFHQAGALLLLTVVLYLNYQLRGIQKTKM
jgi:cytochrome c oxidase assembly protein subunit 15